MSVSMTGRHMTGCHRRTRTASNNINIIEFVPVVIQLLINLLEPEIIYYRSQIAYLNSV